MIRSGRGFTMRNHEISSQNLTFAWFSTLSLKFLTTKIWSHTVVVLLCACALIVPLRACMVATKCVDENIKQARRSFFQYGNIGTFQGDLSPLSTRSFIETCVLPVRVFGCENWILTNCLMMQLEWFQGELAKKALKWPKHLSNTNAVVTLGLPSVRYAVLVQKLTLLLKLMVMMQIVLGIESFTVSRMNDSSMCLLRECRQLEVHFGSNVTDSILHQSETSQDQT